MIRLNFNIATKITFISLILMAVLYHLIPQTDWSNYYNFADKRIILGTPNALDVWSNIIYVLGGLFGLMKLKAIKILNPKSSNIFFIFFISIAILFTGIGSSYFHLYPSLETIFWDRIPMVIVFASILSFIIDDKYSKNIGRISFYFLLIFGLLSQILWKFSIIDLRPYFLIQYFGICFFLIQIIFNKNGRIKNSKLGLVIFSYLIAKIFEIYDREFFLITHFISGHTLKHIVSGCGIIYFIKTISDKND